MLEDNSNAPNMGSESTDEEESVGYLDEIVREMADEPHERGVATRLIKDYLDDRLEAIKQMAVTKGISKKLLRMDLTERIAELDQLIGKGVDQVIHHPEFQTLEASWKGLEHLVYNTETSPLLKIRTLNTTVDEVYTDLDESTAHDSSDIWHKLYRDQFDQLGGEPYGAIIGDYYFGKGKRDVQFLSMMSEVASGCHAPFITSTKPDMFEQKDWASLENILDIESKMDGPKWEYFHEFRKKEDARYVGLTLPNYLGRAPYDPLENPVKAFEYKEDTSNPDGSNFLWSNSAYLYATRLTQSFDNYGWCTAIRGKKGGGEVTGLPKYWNNKARANLVTNVKISGSRENELSKMGFMALQAEIHSSNAVFVSGQSVQKPDRKQDEDENASAQLSARLPYIFAVSRIAHFIKSIVRDEIGGGIGRGELERQLNKWISSYVNGAPEHATPAQKAKFPLIAARVDVREVPGQPGVYEADFWIKPIMQLESINVKLSLVAKLPEPKG